MMNWLIRVVLMTAIASVVGATARADALARALGHFGETVGDGETVTGSHDAETSDLNLFDDSGDEFQAVAQVHVDQLRAYARAKFTEAPEGGEGAYANALATWGKTYHVQNPAVLANVPAGVVASAYFEPVAHGDLLGDSSAMLTGYMTDFAGLELYQTKEFTAQGQLAEQHGSIQLRPLLSFIVDGLYFEITLTTSAGAHARGDESIADFFSTAFLPPIYIGDANGNPIPELSGLQIVDDTGNYYPVTVVQKTPGDYNGNGTVDAADYVVWRHTYGQTGLTLDGDGDGSAAVDAEDYTLWRLTFGNVASFGAAAAGGAAVPEPACATVAIVAMWGAATYRRSRGRIHSTSVALSSSRGS